MRRIGLLVLVILAFAGALGWAVWRGPDLQHRLVDVVVPMRDGVRLSADVYLPEGAGPFPVLITRSPYPMIAGKAAFRADSNRAGVFVRAGFAVVVQDTRGRGDSEGQFGYHFTEGHDGFDTVEWAARQPWSNGRIGMFGNSYMGLTQVMAIRERPPALECAMPAGVPGRHVVDQNPYVGGAWTLEWALSWLAQTAQGEDDRRSLVDIDPAFRASVDWDQIYRHRPLLTMDEALGRRTPLYREWMAHPTFDAYWQRDAIEPDHFRTMRTRSLVVTGWFDAGGQPGSLEYFAGMRRYSPAAANQHVLIGAWEHGSNSSGVGVIPEAGKLDIDSVSVAWFNHCLKGVGNAAPVAQVFVTGVNEWRHFDAYPPRQAAERRLYLRSEGRANSLRGNGRLSWNAPSGDEARDRFSYDPQDPVPSAGSGPLGTGSAGDQRTVEARDDVLVYSTEPLTEPIEVIGPVQVELHAATDGRDTDWIVKLVDVHPDGRAVRLGQMPVGVLRARYREGFDRETLVIPGQPAAYRISLYDVGHVFRPGHRIRLEVTSSAYPFIAPNPNTGLPIATDTTWRVARQTVYHDRARPSSLVLPVLPHR